MKTTFHNIFLTLIGLIFACESLALESGAAKPVTIHGRTEITLTTPTITLGDIADVIGASPLDDETVIGIKKIFIAESPSPGREQILNASKVLERLHDEGVNLQRVGYTLPSNIKIRRASRQLTLREVQNAIENYFKESGKSATIKQINYKNEIAISPGEAEIKAIPFSTRDFSQAGFDIHVAVNNVEEARFSVTTGVEEWKEVPVAARTLSRGTLVAPEDLRMARLNVNALPKDIALQDSAIIGHEVAYEVSQGDFFREAKLNIPPLVTAGQSVIVRYRVKALEATATGIALDAGVKGQEVRVRNAVSKKVISGVVLEAGLVEVRNLMGTQVLN